MPAQSGPGLRISLLGGFQVTAGQASVRESAWRLRRARGLVKLLALAPEHSLHREQVIEALWPEHDPALASNNLRQALFVARRALDSCGEDGGERIVLAHDSLSLQTNRLEIDVEAFETAAAQAECHPTVDQLRSALDLYGGELLPEDRFESWAAERREALRDRHLGLLISLAHLHDRAGDQAAAVASLRQALLDEPLHEHAHRELMRIYAVTGRRQRALAQYHLLRESLRRDFADEPDEQTRRLYQDILTRRPAHRDVSGSALAAPQAIAPSRPGNLPLQLTSFVGRDRALGEIVGLVRRHRLATLTGPGGCGKTRLAVQAADALRIDSADGVWLCELAGLSDGDLVAHAVGATLGVESRSGRRADDTVSAHIGERRLLLVLDNCEHLIEASAVLVDGLLQACPNLRVLATSREPLHVAGEVSWRVPSLSPSEAERLFFERAEAVSSPFAVSADNASDVAEICRRVDGMPLAIELAAANVGLLAPAQIAARLRESLSVLSGGRRTGLTRQQTLAATIDWSHQLLDAEERTLFRRLGTFAGSCTLAAVEDVCEGTLDVLGRVVDKSLVVVEEREGAAAYRLLDTVRHYARERLDEAGERNRFQARHRAHYLRLARALEPTIDDPDARRELAREVDEVRWALRTALSAEPELALELAGALWRFWHDRGDRTEGAGWLEDSLRAAPGLSLARARALHGLSVLALRTGDHRRALETATEAVAHFRGSGDRRALAEELHHLGTMAWVFSDYAGSERWCEESRAIAEAAGERAIVASVVHTLGVMAASRTETATGRRLIAEGVELLRELPEGSDALLLPVALGYGRLPASSERPMRRFLEQTFVTARRVKPAGAVAYALCDLAAAARYEGEMLTSRTLLDESLVRFRWLGDELGAAQALGQLGNLLCSIGRPEPGIELLEESLAIREAADDARGIGLALLAISLATACAGETGRAWRSAERAVALFERTDDGPGRAAAVMQLGYLAADDGRLPLARELQQQALLLWRAFVPNTLWCGSILLELAGLERALGERASAHRRLQEARRLYLHNGDQAGLAYCEKALRRTTSNALLTPE